MGGTCLTGLPLTAFAGRFCGGFFAVPGRSLRSLNSFTGRCGLLWGYFIRSSEEFVYGCEIWSKAELTFAFQFVGVGVDVGNRLEVDYLEAEIEVARG